MYVVVTESLLLMFDLNSKIKNVARLISWGTLASLECVRRNLENPDLMTLCWRKTEKREPFEVHLLMQNASECINLLVKHLKRFNITTKKNYEKKRKIFANEVDSSALKGL
eukprot:CAMPEP_0116878500 /NCGR_PEP_ID=MMETSP0463-20121206/10254_1 /TAXON_ID=181622 /ORGANISM="Strombidinopsis sp, Strain SopsisLIS2011" /LENGTH=110 /DNA_ID=CAMNT_0004526791 /DNA_START=573 /DNA_END=905 /DNA_ORIENTATION=-